MYMCIDVYCRTERTKQDAIVAKYALQQHQQGVSSQENDEDCQRLSICRSHLFSNAMLAFTSKLIPGSRPFC